MSLELATTLYDHIGRIKHLRTFEFLKAIEENQGEDQWSRISYAEWRDKYGIHAFILNECVKECLELKLLEIGRESKSGMVADGGKGTKRLYKLNLRKPDSNMPEEEQMQVFPDQRNGPSVKIPDVSIKSSEIQTMKSDLNGTAANSTKQKNVTFKTKQGKRNQLNRSIPPKAKGTVTKKVPAKKTSKRDN